MILVTIGRNQGNKIVINHASVSGLHAEIKVKDDGSIFLVDKSTNGTVVRGQRVNKEVEIPVNRGDKITFAGVADLDWSKIPTIAPPPPGWQVYSIGSDLNNRIQINDSSGYISRFHATVKIDPNGKIYINDHSTNGTFVNGMKIPSNTDYPIKRRDQVMLANTQPLDWNRIKPGSSSVNIWHIILPVAAALLIGFGIFGWQKGWLGGNTWTLEKTYRTYSNSIVCVIHSYYITGEDSKGVKYMFTSDEEGNLSGAPMGTNEAASLSPIIIYGTAFLVDKQGTMVTNRHITRPWETNKGKLPPEIKNVDGITTYMGVAYNNTSISKYADFEECSILSTMTDDESKDVGLLKVKNLKQLPISFTPINLDHAIVDSKMMQVGQIVYLIGYPLGINMFGLTSVGTTNTIEVKLTSQQGTVSQVPDKYKFGHNAASYGGASGSPVFNNKGQLVGIHNAGLGGSGIHGYNWAILAKHAKDLYDKEYNR